ncbi:hypothetical protein ACFL4G_02455 [Thermodesulfobacteriota bacterium]
MKSTRGIRIGLTALVLTGGPASGALAETETTLNPILRIGSEFRDRVLFSRQMEDYDVVTSVVPKVLLSLESSRISSDLSLSVGREFFARERDLDATIQFHMLEASVELSPRWSMGLEADFSETYSIEQELETSGLVVDRSRRRSWIAHPSISIKLNERTTLIPSCLLTWSEYENPVLIDTRSQTGLLQLSRELINEKTVLSMATGVSVLAYQPEESFADLDSIESAFGGMSIRHEFSETFQFNASVGYRYMRRGLDLSLQDEHGEHIDGHALEASARLTREFELFIVDLAATRGIANTPRGFTTIQNRANLTVSFHPLETLALYINGQCLNSETFLWVEDLGSERDIDSILTEGTAGIARLLGRHFMVELFYRHTLFMDEIRDSDIDNHYVVLNVLAHWKPIEELSAVTFQGSRYGIRTY